MLKLLGFLFLVVLVLAGIGYFAGWFEVRTAHAGDDTKIQIGVNGDEIERDTRTLRESAGKAAESVGRTLSGESTIEERLGEADEVVRGNLTAIELGGLRVDAGGGPVQVELTSETEIYRNGEPVARADLVVGDRVAVAYDIEGTQRRVMFVSASGD